MKEVPYIDEEPEREKLAGKADTALKRYVEFLLERILQMESTGTEHLYGASSWRWLVEEYLMLSAILAADRIHEQAKIEPLKVPAIMPAMGWLEALALTPWVAGLLVVLGPLAGEMSLEAVEGAAALDRDGYLQLRIKAAPAPGESRFATWLGDMENKIRHHAQQVELAKPEIGYQFTHAEYVTRDDERVRDRPNFRHRPFHGLVAARSWSGWPIIRPLNGYGCRCSVRFITRYEAKSHGWLDAAGNPTFSVRWPNARAREYFRSGEFPDKGFHGPKLWVSGLKQKAKGAA